MVTEVKLTPAQAKHFDRHSHVNASIVESALKCSCQPYQDVFTYNRWKALGYQVQRGQHSINLALIKMVDKELEDGTVEQRRIFGSSSVFCRCQVKPVSTKAELELKPASPQPVKVNPADINLMEGWRLV